MFLSILNGSYIVNAQTFSGNCNYYIFWKFEIASGELIIWGNGEITNWGGFMYVPWDSFRSEIKSLKVMDGVTRIGDFSFEKCENLSDIMIADSVMSIGYNAFYNTSFYKNPE